MPRPKRTKVAPSAPAPRVRNTAKAIAAVANSTEARRGDFNDLYDVSDPEDGVVTSARRINKNSGKEKAGALPVSRGLDMSGGRGNKERDGKATNLETNHAALEDERAESLLPEIDLASSSPAVEVGRKERSTPAVESSMLAMGNFKRRPRQPSILGRGPGRARSSSVESNLAEDNGLTSVGRRNTSALGVGNFKRRPRENSILGRRAPSVAPSSNALEMDVGTPAAKIGSAMKIGTFKRRAREPSILRTAQKPRQEEQLDYDDDEDDFNPEDESTPLQLSKRRSITSSSAASSSNSKKRKLSAVQVPQSSPNLPSPTAEGEDTIPATGPLSDDEEAEPSPMVRLSIEARSDSPEPFSETMAPPQSSSPGPPSPSASPSPELPSRSHRAPSRGRRTARGRTPPPRTQDSPISSPPSLTHSPNRPDHAAPTKPKPARQAPPPSTLSTAQLQALLPRRRRQATRDPFDIPSSEDEVDVSGLAPDDDELSHLTVQARSRRHASVRARTPAPLRRGPKVKQPIAKQNATTVKRTYGARANPASDKENDAEVDPDDSLGPIPDEEVNGGPEDSQELEKRVGKELKMAAKKFQEVDKWEMEFEEVTASSSSPRDGR